MDNKHPLIVVLGLDPVIHEIPPLLKHHLQKMQKDFVIRFLSEEDLCKDVVEDLKKLMAQVQFVPTKKELIKKPLIIKPGEA